VTAARGGRRAALPAEGWQPPQRFAVGGSSTVVRFIEEGTGWSRDFDFSTLLAPAGVQCWLAGAFARRTGPRSGVRRLKSAKAIYGVCRLLAKVLSEAGTPVTGPEQVTGAHIAQFVLRHAGMSSGRTDLIELRALLRDDPALPAQARAALLSGRVRDIPDEDRTAVTGYDAREWQLVMTALRRDVRVARERITAGRALLCQWRAGELTGGGAPERLGVLLDVFDRTGDLPRQRDGKLPSWVARAGGMRKVAGQLCLTVTEMAAFCLLLTALTGENFGTVARWPATAHHPGGAGDQAAAVVLVEQVKPRRGPDQEHMVRALEDLPRGLPGLAGDGDTEPLFRSPARLYLLLIDLTEVSRRFSGQRAAFSACSPQTGNGRFLTGVSRDQIRQWTRHAGSRADGRLPPIDVGRIRQTVIEHARRPVSHTRATMNDQYLARSQAVRDDSQIVVAGALRGELAKARRVQLVPVLTAGLVARFGRDPAGAAAETGIGELALAQMIAGRRDTAVAACTDHLSGPHAPAGVACTASFLACLDCVNARALPHHLPAQIAMAGHLQDLRPHLEPVMWQARYEPRLVQLQQILAAYTQAERDQAGAAVTPQQRDLVRDVLAGGWDLQ
jgi:hypothetical protein